MLLSSRGLLALHDQVLEPLADRRCLGFFGHQQRFQFHRVLAYVGTARHAGQRRKLARQVPQVVGLAGMPDVAKRLGLRMKLIEKFLDCAQYAARPIPKQSLEEVIELVMNLESLSDMGLLSHYL